MPSTESITPELFREHLADPAARPLLVRHSPEIAASEALRSWTWVGLRERIGDRKVDCRCFAAHPTEYREGRRYSIEQVPFDAYCSRIIDRDPEACRYYLATSNAAQVFPELFDELPTLPLVGKIHAGPFLWFASEV